MMLLEAIFFTSGYFSSESAKLDVNISLKYILKYRSKLGWSFWSSLLKLYTLIVIGDPQSKNLGCPISILSLSWLWRTRNLDSERDPQDWKWWDDRKIVKPSKHKDWADWRLEAEELQHPFYNHLEYPAYNPVTYVSLNKICIFSPVRMNNRKL